ncbi:c088f0bd-d75a-458a-bcb9-27931fb61fb6 [Thermothielavioides terrestris]|uniref:C088f0bd-d75a-458a-bcb9-27931fb61fb6 n=1 Tax=Thermothielavioides terrestris TaxID=2587410 RepID=A0A3S4ARS7_9PEZI|nr:c088f0bd-d75a-458a-bcb9-27931fb61fb6 [Thermothielavioides terrestris]
MATEDARYRQSSQYQLWSFSPSQLAAMREKTNAAARARIAERLASQPASSRNTSAPTSSANTPDPDGASTPALPEFLTPAEEALLVTFYVSELLRAGDHAEMTDEIKATAAAFFRRFYVTNSIMTYPPTEMLIVALFFACKAEGAFPSITDFGKTFGRENPEEILAGEFLLCQGLRFAIDVKHPFRALRGAVMELSTLPGIEPARLTAAEHRAREILRFSPLMTDAYFHYTPSQIMLAALSLADRGLAERLITETFHYVEPPANNSGADTPASSGPDAPAAPKRTAPRSSGGGGSGEDRAQIIGSHLRDKVLGTIEACRDMLSKELPERREHWTNRAVIKAQITPIRKKLNKCHDPERWNLVELQRARREQASRRADSEDRDPAEGGGGGKGGTLEDDAAVFGAPLPLGQASRDPKRRKVGGEAERKGLDDPFGPPL